MHAVLLVCASHQPDISSLTSCTHSDWAPRGCKCNGTLGPVKMVLNGWGGGMWQRGRGLATLPLDDMVACAGGAWAGYLVSQPGLRGWGRAWEAPNEVEHMEVVVVVGAAT